MNVKEINSYCRFTLIDKLKGVGILLVMIGHAPGLLQVKYFLYAFHVPLFFIISGFLLTDKHLVTSFSSKCAKLFKSLLVPYMFFFFISWVYWSVTKQYANLPAYLKEKTYLDAFIGGCFGTGRALFVNPALWFFVALFWVALIYHVAAGYVKDKIVLFGLYFILFYMAVHFLYDQLARENLIVLQVLAGLTFYSFGVVARQCSAILNFLESNRSILCLPFFFYLSYINGSVDLNFHVFGFSPLLYFVSAVLGFFCLAWISNFFSLNQFLLFLSLNSLFIFATHMVIFKMVTAFYQIVTGAPSPYISGEWWFSFMYVFLTLFIVFKVAPYFNKNLPFLVGRSI